MATINMALKPWGTPNFANIDGNKVSDALNSISVKDLPQQALDELVCDWIKEVYQKAGKPSHWENTKNA